jgi:hypothetical protein
MNAVSLISLIFLLQASHFDMQGTIEDVISPSCLLIGNERINLEDVDASGLTARQYELLMDDLRNSLKGKDVLIKGGYVYFDLVGSYNSQSINEMTQKEISDLKELCLFVYDTDC